jgi:hypothetical protein
VEAIGAGFYRNLTTKDTKVENQKMEMYSLLALKRGVWASKNKAAPSS